MSPLIGPGTDFEEINKQRFVRVKKDIGYSDDPFDNHARIAQKQFKLRTDPPLIDDGGRFDYNFRSKTIDFIDETSSCKIKNRKNARKETYRIARENLGAERVG